jgi:ribosome production factor 2
LKEIENNVENVSLLLSNTLHSKAKTAKGRRVLQSREAQTEEGAKTAVFLKATSTSEKSTMALTDLYALKKPNAVMFSKRNDIHPFTDHSSLSFFSEKNQGTFSHPF